VAEQIQVVQHPVGQHVLQSRIKEDKSEERAVQEHWECVTRPISGGADSRGVFLSAAIEHIQVVDDPRRSAGSGVLERGNIAEPGGVLP